MYSGSKYNGRDVTFRILEASVMDETLHFELHKIIITDFLRE